jgi:hypothetical protein
MVTANEFVELALTQAGDRYVFGAEADLDDPNPSAFDCSELIQWVGARLKVSPPVPDGSWIQARHCRNEGSEISIKEALGLRGALLFRFSGGSPFSGPRPTSAHVAISLGDNRTMEARSTAQGVGVFGNAASRTWTHAAKIPGVDYRDPSSLARHPAAWAKAVDAGITNGDRPRDFATREEVAIMAMRAAGT